MALLLVLLLALPAGAEEPWLDAEPFTVPARALLDAAEGLPVPREADVLILWRDVEISFDASHRARYRQHLIYRVLTPDGADGWATSKIAYAPWYQDRPTLRARVVTPDATEHLLAREPSPAAGRAAANTTQTAEALDERRLLETPLPAVTVGAVVEEVVEVRDHAPAFSPASPTGTAGVAHLAMFAPIHRGRLVLAAPRTLPLRYGMRIPGQPTSRPEPRKESDGELVRLVFEYERLAPAGEAPSGLPPNQARFPHIAYSTGSDWRGVARGYAELVDSALAAGAGDALEELAADIERRQMAQTERLPQLLEHLRGAVRPAAVPLDAAPPAPASPAVTLERGYGASKDLAAVLVALLRREEIPAYVALLRAGPVKDVDTALPGYGRFDHALVYVPASPPIWIDPSEPGTRVGELPARAQGRWALVASPNTTKLRRTPSANSIDNRTFEERLVVLADHGPSRIVETTTYHGESERQQRAILRTSDAEERRAGYLNYAETAYLADRLGEVAESDGADLRQPFQLKIEALDCGRAVTDLSEAVVAIRFENLFAGLPQELREGFGPRRQPFYVSQPYVAEWLYRIVAPSGFELREAPEDVERRLGPGLFTRRVRMAGDGPEIHVAVRFDSGPRVLTPEQFEAMRRGVRAFLGDEPLLLWFDHLGALALAEGRVGDAITRFRRLADAESDKAIHRVRLTQGLLAVGLGAEARRQARRAVALEDGSALAHWALGHALQHDTIGRRFRPGFDREAALVELRRAVELDPRNPLARTELAILLEYDAKGRRYRGGADLAGALEQYHFLRDELGAVNLDVNIISALFWSQRWRELEEATRDPDTRSTAPQVSRYLRLVAVAVLEGGEAAIREAARLSPRDDEQMALLSIAAQHLVIARRYPAAAVLLRRAARAAPNPTAILRRADLLARAVHHEDIEIEEEGPAVLAQRFLLTVGREEITLADAAEIFHPAYVADRNTAELSLVETLREMQQEQVRSAGELPLAAVTDLALAVLHTEVDGSPEKGFRVRMASGLSHEALPLSLYVTADEGRWVIAALDGDFGQIGKEVLRRLAGEDLKGAHQWLDWAREAIEPFPTGDPYGIAPFAEFWTRGTGAFTDKMRLGAALLTADQPEAATGRPILEAALADTSDERERRIVEAALLMAYVNRGETAKAGAHSRRLLARQPTSDVAFLSLADHLYQEGLFDELAEICEERLVRLPDDIVARRFLIQADLSEGDIDTAVRRLGEIAGFGRLSVADANQWAWLELFSDEEGALDRGLELARDGAERAQYREPQILHTLAAIHAQRGETVEAYRTILQSLRLREDGEPAGHDAWIFGRIAEEYGFHEAAREAYLHVPREAGRYTTWQLAQRRLKRLGKDD